MNKQRVIIVCPGRGSYTRDTKGYLKKYGGTATEYIQWVNEKRLNDNYESLTRLDSMPFRSKIHMIGEDNITINGFYDFEVNNEAGGRFLSHARFTFVFQKQDSDIKILSHHSSVMPS